MKRITIKEIAKALEVSVSTVSKALNDSYEISEGTKEKIKKYAKEHKYRPNSLAISLQNRKTKNIAVLIPSILNHFFAKVLNGIETVATEKGYHIVTCFTHESYEKESHIVEMLNSGFIDGFIGCISEETLKIGELNHFKQLIEDNVPLILFDRVHKDLLCDKVVIDNVKTAYKTTRFLMKSDCENIALVSTINGLNVGKFRVKGYEKALKNYGEKVNKDRMILLKKPKNLKKKLSKMLETQKVDAIFALDETSAVLALQVVSSYGKKVPEDISIIGFSNSALSKYSVPSLTTVNQFGAKMGKTAAERLIHKIEGKIKESDVKIQIIRTELIERESTKKRFIKF